MRGRDAQRLAYQVVKGQQRGGWPHRNLLTLSHPVSAELVVTGLAQLVARWRGRLHRDRVPDQVAQDRFSMVQAQELMPCNAPLLLTDGMGRTPGSLVEFGAEVTRRVAV